MTRQTLFIHIERAVNLDLNGMNAGVRLTVMFGAETTGEGRVACYLQPASGQSIFNVIDNLARAGVAISIA